MVCLFHFSRALPSGFGKEICSYGNLGVDIFFVVSGFVMPYYFSRIFRENWSLPVFLLKRFYRLYPAYVAATFLSLALWYGSALMPGFRGNFPTTSLPDILLNLAFLSDIFHRPWAIPVFWSLAIEWQYYFLIAISIPWVLSEQCWKMSIGIAIWIGCTLLPFEKAWLPAFGAVFAVGFLVCLRRDGRLQVWPFIAGMLLALVAYGYRFRWQSAVMILVTALIILFWRWEARWLKWLGMISYSLYLTHPLIGGRMMNLAERYPENWLCRGGFLGLALVASVLFAWLFYRICEKPTHQLAQKIGSAKFLVKPT